MKKIKILFGGFILVLLGSSFTLTSKKFNGENCITSYTQLSCRDTPARITTCCNSCSTWTLAWAGFVTSIITEEQVCGANGLDASLGF